MKRRAHLTLVNDLETSAIEISDRGLAYGDGLFETLRVVNGEIPLLPYHLKRLIQGSEVLGLGESQEVADQFNRYVQIALKDLSRHAHLEQALIKVIVTRGHGGRGYLPPQDPDLCFITQVFEYPEYPQSNYQSGVSLRLCDHRLSHQPALAGVKHLNRLDQVLASKELENSGAEEGLVLDYQGQVIEGTKSNLLIIRDDRVVTPRIDHAGVAGTLRQYLLDNRQSIGVDVHEECVSLDQVRSAQGLALINSVFGLWPVKEFESKRYEVHEICGRIQSHLKIDLSF